MEPNSGSMHVPIEGSTRTAKKIEDRSRIGGKRNQNHFEKEVRTYLERIRNRMQKPIEGRSRLKSSALYREGGMSQSRAASCVTWQ